MHKKHFSDVDKVMKKVYNSGQMYYSENRGESMAKCCVCGRKLGFMDPTLPLDDSHRKLLLCQDCYKIIDIMSNTDTIPRPEQYPRCLGYVARAKKECKMEPYVVEYLTQLETAVQKLTMPGLCQENVEKEGVGPDLEKAAGVRSEQEMMDLILDFARNHEEIRAVYMTGSRANKNAPKDIFQDYDIVYGVMDTLPFIKDKSWIKGFGSVAVMQEPDYQLFFKSENKPEDKYSYLVQFTDINRIDFTFLNIRHLEEDFEDHTYVVKLLDKDNRLPDSAPDKEAAHYIQPPAEGEYYGCINEFHWVSTYVAKGLWRGELLYAMEHMNNYVRPQLLKMLTWQVGIDTGYTIGVGKCSKYIYKYLPEQIWQRYLTTYSTTDNTQMWEALMLMQELFNETAAYVGKMMKCEFPVSEAERTKLYLEMVRSHSMKNV